jgi:hypothetical protein
MFDCITHSKNVAALNAELREKMADVIDTDDAGHVRYRVDKTPSVRSANESISLVRYPSLAATDGLENLCVLAYAPTDPANPRAAFDVLFADPDATAVYDRVYDQSEKTFPDENGETQTYTPPRIFGVFA